MPTASRSGMRQRSLCSTRQASLPDPKILWSPRVGINWDVVRNATHAGARRHRHLHRTSGLRLDFQPDRQHRRAHRLRLVRQHHESAVPSRSQSLQADGAADRRSRSQLRAGADQLGFQVPADLAQQHRRRPAAAMGAHGHRGVRCTTRTSTASTTSTRTCRRTDQLRRRGRPAAVDEQSHPLAHLERRCPEKRERRLVLEFRDVAGEEQPRTGSR